MAISSHHKDQFILTKIDGTVLAHKISGRVDNSNKIFIHVNHLPPSISIEDGDLLDRIMPNQKTERYQVLDCGYKSGIGGLPSRYECKVKKESAIQPERSSATVYNLIGHNSRINNQSTDFSKNVVNLNSENIFSELRSIIKEQIDLNEEILFKLDAMEKNNGTSLFKGAYVDFISLAANHMSILSPYLPQLSQMLVQVGN